MSRCAVGIGLALVALGMTSRASANGRFPAANQLVFDAVDGKHAAVRTTFGLLQTTDGSSFRWICEKALGYEGVFDPAIAIGGAGKLLVGLPDGLSRSADRGCVWDRAAAPVAGEYVIDLAVDPANAARVVAITGLGEGAPPGSQAKLFFSNDGGATFGAAMSLPEDFRPQTVDLAKTSATRIYASGLSPFARFAMFVRSDDGGATWTESTFDLGDASGAYIAGVDPTNADRLYLRIDGATNDELRFSSDGGGSFATVLSGPQLLGFAISPDGKQIAAGGPGMGVHVSGPEHSFKKTADHSVRCLTWTADALYACGTDPGDPFAIGRSTDNGASFATVFRLVDLEPLACGSTTTTGSICPAYWPDVSRIIKPAPDAGAVDAAPMFDAQNDARADAAEPAPPAESASGGGCGCSVRDGGFGFGAALTLIVAIALAHKRRTRP